MLIHDLVHAYCTMSLLNLVNNCLTFISIEIDVASRIPYGENIVNHPCIHTLPLELNESWSNVNMPSLDISL